MNRAMLGTMNEMMTSAQVARHAGVSIPTVTRATQRGDLKPAYVAPGPNGLRLFAPDEVERWVAARQAATA